MLIHSAEITGSVQFNNTDVSAITNVAGFATTASVDALVVKTGSYASTSSVNELQSKTGSYTSTSSFDAYSSSINTFTSSATTRLNTIESVTGSYASTSSVNDLQSVTGSFATTGSNQFNGNQSISGSITSNGTITAQTLVVQTVTSSIEFVTGSTRNGSIAENTHQFTGSVLMTGSLSVTTTGTELQVNASGVNIGNALTDNHIISGSLRVNTNALFISSSGNVGVGTTTLSSFGSQKLVVVGSAAGEVARFTDGINADIVFDNPSASVTRITAQYGGAAGVLVFANGSGFTERMRITAAGNVGIGTNSPGEQLTLSRATYPTIKLIETTDNASGYFQYHSEANEFRLLTISSHPLIFSTTDTERMRITSAGDVQVGGNSVAVDRTLTEVAVSTYSLPSNGPVQNNGSTTAANARNYNYGDHMWGTSGASQAQNENAGVSMDFGSAQSIKRIVLYGYNVSDTNSWKVSYSSDNTNWTILRVFPHIPFANAPMVFDFNASGLLSYRYWRIQINSWTPRNNTNWYAYECIAYI